MDHDSKCTCWICAGLAAELAKPEYVRMREFFETPHWRATEAVDELRQKLAEVSILAEERLDHINELKGVIDADRQAHRAMSRLAEERLDHINHLQDDIDADREGRRSR